MNKMSLILENETHADKGANVLHTLFTFPEASHHSEQQMGLRVIYMHSFEFQKKRLQYVFLVHLVLAVRKASYSTCTASAVDLADFAQPCHCALSFYRTNTVKKTPLS